MKNKLIKSKLSLNRLIIIFILFIGFSFSGALFGSEQIHALSISDWNAGRIIDDAVFTDNTTMSVDQIQQFLNSKVTNCDTNGTQPAADFGRPDITHAQYAASRGWSAPPYICLKDYTENGISSAQIIYNISQKYQINPQVFIVLLQKEQGLVTDTWPLPIQYKTATGYGCPDTAACAEKYYGLTAQLTWSATLFHTIITNSQIWSNDYASGTSWYSPYILGNNKIYYNPGPCSATDGNGNCTARTPDTCGSSIVNIQNRATQALYSYTPYQPNDAVLNWRLGNGPSVSSAYPDCGAFGNINFFTYFNNWFNPSSTIKDGVTMKVITEPIANPARGQDVNYVVSFTNNLNSDITIDAIGIVGRGQTINSNINRDFGWQGPITLKPGIAQQLTFTTTIKDTGMLYAWPAINYQGRYIHYNNWGVALNAHQANLSIVTPLTSSTDNPIAGQNVTFSTSVKNNEPYPVRIDSIGIPIRYYDTYNYDVAWNNSINTISAGATQNLSGSIVFDKPGPYTAWVSWNIGGQYTTISPIKSYNASSLNPNFILTYIETPNPTPAIGEDVVIKFKLKNTLSVPITINAIGVVGRYNNPYSGTNRDFGWVGPETFAPNEEKSYTTFVSTVSEPSDFFAWVAINYNGLYTHYNTWGFVMRPHTPNLSIVSPITTNFGNPIQLGQTTAITASIKNNEPNPIHYNALGIPIRYYGAYNYDAAWTEPGVLSASGQIGDTLPLVGTVKFDKPGPYTLWTSMNIKDHYITIGNQKELNL